MRTAHHFPNRFAPALHRLEGRDLASASVALTGDTLFIQGGDGPSSIKVYADGHGGVSATVTGRDSAQGSGVHVQRVVIATESLADSVDVTALGQVSQALYLDLGLKSGNQRVSLDFSRGVAAALGIAVRGGDGNDRLTVNLGTVRGGQVSLAATLGAGDDNAQVNLGDVTGGGKVAINLDGGADNDFLSVQSQGRIDGSSSVSLNLQGGAGEDWLRTRVQDRVDGRLTIRADGGADRDIISTRLTANPGSTGRIVGQVVKGSADQSVMTYTDGAHGGAVTWLDNMGAIVRGVSWGTAYSMQTG